MSAHIITQEAKEGWFASFVYYSKLKQKFNPGTCVKGLDNFLQSHITLSNKGCEIGTKMLVYL